MWLNFLKGVTLRLLRNCLYDKLTDKRICSRYKLLLVYTYGKHYHLWESELMTLLPPHTSLAQYFPIDPNVEPTTWLLLENPINYSIIIIIIIIIIMYVATSIIYTKASWMPPRLIQWWYNDYKRYRYIPSEVDPGEEGVSVPLHPIHHSYTP